MPTATAPESATTTVTLTFGEQAHHLLQVRRNLQAHVHAHHERVGIATGDPARDTDPSAMHRLCNLCHLPRHRLGTIGGSTTADGNVSEA